MTNQHLNEGLAQIAENNKGFYNCSCNWSGNALSYADHRGKGQALTDKALSNHRPYKPYQGHCPECGTPFEGCFNY